MAFIQDYEPSPFFLVHVAVADVVVVVFESDTGQLAITGAVKSGPANGARAKAPTHAHPGHLVPTKYRGNCPKTPSPVAPPGPEIWTPAPGPFPNSSTADASPPSPLLHSRHTNSSAAACQVLVSASGPECP